MAGLYSEYLSHVDNSYVKSYEDTDVNICIHCNSKLLSIKWLPNSLIKRRASE